MINKGSQILYNYSAGLHLVLTSWVENGHTTTVYLSCVGAKNTAQNWYK